MEFYNNDGFCLLTLEPVSKCTVENCDDCEEAKNYNERERVIEDFGENYTKDIKKESVTMNKNLKNTNIAELDTNATEWINDSMVQFAITNKNKQEYSLKNVVSENYPTKLLDYENLTKKGLIILIEEYDQYIKEIVEEREWEDRIPVCIHEYLNNDIQDIIMDDIGAISEDIDKEAESILESLSIDNLSRKEDIIEMLLSHDGYIET